MKSNWKVIWEEPERRVFWLLQWSLVTACCWWTTQQTMTCCAANCGQRCFVVVTWWANFSDLSLENLWVSRGKWCRIILSLKCWQRKKKNIFKKFFKQYIVCVPLCLSPANWHEHTPKKLQSPNINLCFTKFVCLKMTSVNSFLFSSCQGLVDVFVAE